MNHRNPHDRTWNDLQFIATKRWLSEISTSPWLIFIIAAAAYFVGYNG